MISSFLVTAQLTAAYKWYIAIPEFINAIQEAFKQVDSNLKHKYQYRKII